ncbi:hypothetical protein HK098_007086 [Nowakowskiella sp. JEL0407]|nr:hypothetical protein HK098_007086 [Nowakowskiella sp. JEL0407]
MGLSTVFANLPITPEMNGKLTKEEKGIVNVFITARNYPGRYAKDWNLTPPGPHKLTVRVIKAIQNEGENVNAPFGEFGTLLHFACSTGSLGAVEYLLEQGCDVNYKHDRLATPLHLAAAAASSVRNDVVECLIRYGADVNAKTLVSLQTPLHYAAKSSNYTVLQVLLNNGAVCDLLDYNNKPPISFLFWRNFADVLVIQRGDLWKVSKRLFCEGSYSQSVASKTWRDAAFQQYSRFCFDVLFCRNRTMFNVPDDSEMTAHEAKIIYRYNVIMFRWMVKYLVIKSGGLLDLYDLIESFLGYEKLYV